ncbi:MAG: tetratricopeptide repeat protein [Phenylobacterium sp.]
MSLDAMFKQANAATEAGRWADAERDYKALIRLKPAWAFHNLGVIYSRTGRFAEAEDAYRAALRTEPTLAASRHSLAMLLLGAGRYAEGWELYEARRLVPGLNIATPRLPFPEWRGESLAGKRLLVIREQGLGDQIQFARFLPQLVSAGAEVVYLCDPPVATLFGGLGVSTVAAQPGGSYPAADYWVFICSLPLRLGVTLEGLSGEPYLSAEPAGPGGIGVKARGGAAHVNDRHRSLPPELARRLEPMGQSLDPEATGARHFADTASLIAGMSLVISVDTAVAHLAGAMGTPTWILLSRLETDWRWLRDRSDSPWYNSVRLFRQPALGEWGPVLDQVIAEVGG